MAEGTEIRGVAATAAFLAALLHAANAMAFSEADARKVVDRAIELISKNYVFPGERAAIVSTLRAKEAQGRYDVSEAGTLVDRLGPDMAAAGNDKHLWIRYDPAQNAALRESGGSEQNAFAKTEGRAHNEGYEALRVLAGNVRYLNMTGFRWNGAETSSAAADSLRFLSGGDAVIIDLRENGGGSAAAVRALVSYFLPPDHRELMTFHSGANGAGYSTYVLDKLPGPRVVGKPLYVLVSNATGSAAEEFAYHVAMFKLGTLVGATTAGAANNDTLYPIGEEFVLSVSTGRPEHPVSHSNWQGEGVRPDVPVAVEKALDEAHLLALKELSARAGADAGRYAWAIAGLEGRLTPPRLDPPALGEYAGTYGARRITVGDGSLVFQRETNPPTTLAPLSPDLFAFANTEHVRIRFRRSAGSVVGFDLITDNGQVIRVDRNS